MTGTEMTTESYRNETGGFEVKMTSTEVRRERNGGCGVN